MFLLKFTLDKRGDTYVAVTEGPIRANEVVEEVPVVTVPYPVNRAGRLRWFLWEGMAEFVVPLGYASCFEESGEPNLKIQRIPGSRLATFVATREIVKGEVLCVDWAREKSAKALAS